MEIFFRKDKEIREEPFIESEIIGVIKKGIKVKYTRTIKIDNIIWIVLENGYILIKENEIQVKGNYIIETMLEKNKIIELKDLTLKINNNNNSYFTFEPIDQSYLISYNNFILGIGRTKEGYYSIYNYKCYDIIDESKKWNLIRIKENLFKIETIFLIFLLKFQMETFKLVQNFYYLLKMILITKNFIFGKKNLLMNYILLFLMNQLLNE